MNYYLDVFSPETYEMFSNSSRNVSGFRSSQLSRAKKIKPGDKLICYLTRISRWVGVLEVLSKPYEDTTPIFTKEDDPFVVRFDVKPVVWLMPNEAIPIKDNLIWENLSFTKGKAHNDASWTGIFRGSLSRLSFEDGNFLERNLVSQLSEKKDFALSGDEKKKLEKHQVIRNKKTIEVLIPDSDNGIIEAEVIQSPRESLHIQALIADIGTEMGFNIWIPVNDRNSVKSLMTKATSSIIDELPINFDLTTIKTIEQIDVLWLRNRTIVRAFEVEHTTSIYSGILRMADLVSLQPNLDIKIHIIAPEERKEKVIREIQRPVFALLEKGPLSEFCTYISYDGIVSLSKDRHLRFLSDEVLDEYAKTSADLEF